MLMRKEERHKNLFRLVPDNIFVIAVATRHGGQASTRAVCYLFLLQTTSSLFRLSIRVSTLPLAS
jgi:hypothetical protein